MRKSNYKNPAIYHHRDTIIQIFLNNFKLQNEAYFGFIHDMRDSNKEVENALEYLKHDEILLKSIKKLMVKKPQIGIILKEYLK